MKQYSLKLPRQYVLFSTNELTFSINYLRSRRPSVIYFILHLYNVDKDEIYLDNGVVRTLDVPESDDSKVAFKSDRCVVGTAYSTEGGDFIYPFEVDEKLTDVAVYSKIEIRTLGVDSENPLYFAEMMFEEGHDHTGYHEPSELSNSHTIDLPTTTYANVYDAEGNYLQVIRPKGESFNTNNLSKAEYTILAPHFEDELEVDGHVAVYLECMNQTEQTIDVLR